MRADRVFALTATATTLTMVSWMLAATSRDFVTVSSDDVSLIEAAVAQLLSDENESPEEKHKTGVLLDRVASPRSYFEWADWQRKTPPQADIEEDLTRRNRTETTLDFIPNDDRIQLCDLDHEIFSQPFPRLPIREMAERFPRCRHWIMACLPGYSSDRNKAVVHLSFGPTMHGKFARYMFRRTSRGWELIAEKTLHLQ